MRAHRASRPRGGTAVRRSRAARRQNARALVDILDEVFAAKTFDEWCATFKTLAGPWSPVATPPDVVADPQARANGYFTEIETGDGRPSVTVVAVPAQLDETSPELVRAPEHGEHTEDVLLSAGLTWEEVAQLKDTGAIL